MTFIETDRPKKNRRRLGDKELEQYDIDLEAALTATLDTGRAIKLPLWRFHSSPAKGRLWTKGFRVAHRVLPDRQTVAAWVEKDSAPRDL